MKPDSTPQPIIAAPEQEEGEHAEDCADQRDEIGRQARPRRPARQVEGRLAPQVERQDVGHALVGGVIGGALDRLGIVGIERQHERPIALAQFGVAELGGFGGEHFIAVDRACRCSSAAATAAASSPAGTCAITGLPPSVSTVRGRVAHRLQPGRVPGIGHAREQRRAPGSGSVGAIEPGVGRQAARALARIHPERPRRDWCQRAQIAWAGRRSWRRA